MAKPKPKPKRIEYLKLKESRERLRERADEIINALLDTVNEAREAQDYKSAVSALTWLLEHMPAEADGTRAIDASVDRPNANAKGVGGPRIQIGLAIGDTTNMKALPKGEVIDVEPS